MKILKVILALILAALIVIIVLMVRNPELQYNQDHGIDILPEVTTPEPIPGGNVPPEENPTPVNDPMSVFTDTTLGFSFDYPSGWGEPKVISRPESTFNYETLVEITFPANQDLVISNRADTSPDGFSVFQLGSNFLNDAEFDIESIYPAFDFTRIYHPDPVAATMGILAKRTPGVAEEIADRLNIKNTEIIAAFSQPFTNANYIVFYGTDTPRHRALIESVRITPPGSTS